MWFYDRGTAMSRVTLGTCDVDPHDVQNCMCVITHISSCFRRTYEKRSCLRMVLGLFWIFCLCPSSLCSCVCGVCFCLGSRAFCTCAARLGTVNVAHEASCLLSTWAPCRNLSHPAATYAGTCGCDSWHASAVHEREAP